MQVARDPTTGGARRRVRGRGSRPPGIDAVASRAGVSVATVSRALRGLPNVAPSTRERVLRAAEDLRYVADPHASRLAAGRTLTVGMVVPLFTRWYFTQVAAGAEEVLAGAGYDLLLYNVGGPATRQRFFRELPFRKRVDGIVVIDLPLSDVEQHTLGDLGIPIVAVGVRTDQLSTVTVDNETAAAAATRHLVDLGHERVGLIAHDPRDPLRFTAPLERRRGFQQALLEAGLDVRPELEVPGHFTLEGGAEAMARLLAVDPPPTAVFGLSDEMAIGALKVLRDAGVPVPAEMSVMGFDDHDMAEFVGLTTVRQPARLQGQVAATLLLGTIDAGGEHELRHERIPTTLTVRATTGRVRTNRSTTSARAVKALAARRGPPAESV